MPRSRCLSLAFTITVFWCCSSPAAPKICIVVDPGAPKLEQFAAQEMSAQLSKLFSGEATLVAAPPAEADGVILLGSPATNPAVKQALGDAWPKLSEQGHLLKSAKLGDRPVLVVGGGSPVATLWAAYELGHHFGVRYLLKSDVYPPEPVTLKFDSLDIVLEPAAETRICVVDPNGSRLGISSWSLADQHLLLGQLAKLKFNRLRLYKGSLPLPPVWWRGRFYVDGETAGRAAFHGARVFTNPDLLVAKTAQERGEIESRLRSGLLTKANELGILENLPEHRFHQQQFLGGGSMLPLMTHQTSQSKPPRSLDPWPLMSIVVEPLPPGDLNPQVYYASRAGFDAKLKLADAYRELFEHVCSNAEVADRLVRGFESMAKATDLLTKVNAQYHNLGPVLLTDTFERGTPPPAELKEVKALYTQSMVEMFRSHGNCRPSSKKYLYYHCKRGEFAVEYLNAYEAVCLAGVAKKAGDQDKCVEQLEKAVESLYNGINSLAEVARDQSDRGLIAALNESAYRPLVKQLEEE